MSLIVTSNATIKNAVEIFEWASKDEQDKMLRLLKLEKHDLSRKNSINKTPGKD